MVRDLTRRLAEAFPQVAAAPPPRVAEVRIPRSWADSAGASTADHEPAAWRLALMHFRHTEPATLSAARLHRAEQTLGRWRYKMALWHDLPPAEPIPAVMAAATDALANGLDTAAVLTELHRLEIDQHAPSGSKFATFSCLDLVLGLDLKHLVGKVLR